MLRIYLSSDIYCLSRFTSDWQAHKMVFSNSIRRCKSPALGWSSPCKDYLSYDGEISQSASSDHLHLHHILKWNPQENRLKLREKGVFTARSHSTQFATRPPMRTNVAPIVKNNQGLWVEIEFRVKVRCSSGTMGCWVNRIHVRNL